MNVKDRVLLACRYCGHMGTLRVDPSLGFAENYCLLGLLHKRVFGLQISAYLGQMSKRGTPWRIAKNAPLVVYCKKCRVETIQSIMEMFVMRPKSQPIVRLQHRYEHQTNSKAL